MSYFASYIFSTLQYAARIVTMLRSTVSAHPFRLNGFNPLSESHKMALNCLYSLQVACKIIFIGYFNGKFLLHLNSLLIFFQ